MKKLFLLSILFVFTFCFKGSAQTITSTFPDNGYYASFQYVNGPYSHSFTAMPDEVSAGETTLSTYCYVWLSSDTNNDFWIGVDTESGTWSGVSYNDIDIASYVANNTNVVIHVMMEVCYQYHLVDLDDSWALN